MINLLLDCERFTREFFPVLNISCLQVYHSALLFTPRKTPLYETFGHMLGLPIQIHNALDETWNPCTRTMDGHSDFVCSVAFSPDGARIVSGSSDKTLQFWDVVSGAHLSTFEGHSDWVKSVAFCPDGTRVVSGSYDKTLRLWDVINGAHLSTLEGHTGWITSVAFSPDGTRVVSGSHDKTL
jgi:WD40 repeat protein